jgi:hypothetical protein
MPYVTGADPRSIVLSGPGARRVAWRKLIAATRCDSMVLVTWTGGEFWIDPRDPGQRQLALLVRRLTAEASVAKTEGSDASDGSARGLSLVRRRSRRATRSALSTAGTPAVESVGVEPGTGGGAGDE